MNKLLYRPITLGASVLGGVLAGAIFRKVWPYLAGDDEEQPARGEKQPSAV